MCGWAAYHHAHAQCAVVVAGRHVGQHTYQLSDANKRARVRALEIVHHGVQIDIAKTAPRIEEMVARDCYVHTWATAGSAVCYDGVVGSAALYAVDDGRLRCVAKQAVTAGCHRIVIHGERHDYGVVGRVVGQAG